MPSVLRGRVWLFAIPAVVSLFGYAILELMGYSGLWPAAGLALTGLCFYTFLLIRPRRCPQCGTWLRERHEPTSVSSYLVKRDCRQCGIVWQCGECAGD